MWGSHKQSQSQDKALAASTASTNAALEYEKQQAAAALAYQKEQDAYNRGYQKSRDSVVDATNAQNRADRGAHRGAAQGAATTLGALLTPGQRVNGATGMVNSADGTARSLADIVRERTQVQTLPGVIPPPESAPPAPAATTPALSSNGGDQSAVDVNKINASDQQDKGMSAPGEMPGPNGQTFRYIRMFKDGQSRLVLLSDVGTMSQQGWTSTNAGAK